MGLLQSCTKSSKQSDRFFPRGMQLLILMLVSVRQKTFAAVDLPIARFMGPTWGPSGADRAQVGPMLASWNLLSGLAPLCAASSASTGPDVYEEGPFYYEIKFRYWYLISPRDLARWQFMAFRGILLIWHNDYWKCLKLNTVFEIFRNLEIHMLN